MKKKEAPVWRIAAKSGQVAASHRHVRNLSPTKRRSRALPQPGAIVRAA